MSHEVDLAHFNPNKNCCMDINALMFKHSGIDLLHATKKSALENLPMWASSYFDLCRQKLINFINEIDHVKNMHKNC